MPPSAPANTNIADTKAEAANLKLRTEPMYQVSH